MTKPKLPPPLRKPTSEYPTPSPIVGFFTEIIDRTDQAYQKNAPVKRGTLYSTINGAKQNIIDAYPLLYFVREQKFSQSDQLCIWIWSTAFDAESSYNAEVDYIGEAVACPAFSRVYNVRRDVYEASPTINPGTTLTALVAVRITAGGTGYTQATGAVGTGAKVQFVIDPTGAIISGIVTVEGSAVTTGQAITITGDGSGATATAIVQPVGAVLTSQKKQELPQDDPLRNEFVRVIRVYELLPGPYIPANRYDPDLGVITGRRRAVLNSGQAAAVTSAHSLRYEGREGSSIVSWEIEESWDNTAFPEPFENIFDPERGPVLRRTKVTTDTTTGASLTVAGSTISKTEYERFPSNPSLRLRILETWIVPGPIITSTEFERDGIKKVVTRQQMLASSVVTSETLNAGTLTRKFKERLNELLATQIIDTITVDNNSDLLDLPSYTTSIKNLIPEIFLGQIPLDTTSHIVEGTASNPTLNTDEFEHSERQLAPLYFEERSTFLDASLSLPVTISGGKETNAQKQVVTVAMKLCVDSTTPSVPTALIDVDFKKLGNGLAVEITKTIASVFDATTFAKQRGDAVPERFKKATPAITEKHSATGTASAPSLSSGDVEKFEQQKDSFVKETSVTNRAVGGYPALSGQTYNESLDVVIPYTETIVAEGTGGARADVTPLGTDIYGSAVALKKTIDAAALITALNAFSVEFPGSASLRLPDTLETIESVFESSQGDGTFEETGDFSGVNPGFSISLRGSGQGSGSLMPSLKIDIQENRADHIPTTHHLFYLPSPVSVGDVLAASGATQTWPKFRPRAHTFLCIGRRVSVHAEASTQLHVTDTDTISTTGAGKSREVALIINEVRIPPTIHDSISVDGDTSDDVSAISGEASVDTGLSNASSSISDFVDASIDPASVTSTPGDFVIPTSGICLLDCHCEPAGMLNYVRVHAETFDWADVSP